MAPRQRTLFEFGTPVVRKDRVYKMNSIPGGEESDSDPGNIKFEHGGQPTRSPSDLGRGIKAKSARPKRNATSSIVSSDGDSEDRVSPPQKLRTNKRNKNTTIVSSSSEDDLRERRSKKKRRIVRGKRPSSSPSNAEDHDILEEVDDDLIIEERFRNRTGTSKYAANLERLKRRRKGQKSESEASEENENGSNSDVDNDGEVSYSDLGYIPGARPTELLLSDEEQMEGEFIVDDDENDILPELPAEFSMRTFQDLSNHFKVVCQLFVHLAMKKARNRRSFIEEATQKTYFSIPIAVINRKLNGIKDSLVASSLWKADFKNALEKYPDFRLEYLNFSIPRCDACHLGGRVSKLRGVLSGREYDKKTYEPSTNDEGEGTINWDLGRFCAARVQVYHMFSHWQYQLYHNLCIEIEAFSDSLTSGGQNSKDLDADSVMERLDGKGIINGEWHRIKEMMERAHNLEARGGDDDLDMS